jgi:hypothetical protein
VEGLLMATAAVLIAVAAAQGSDLLTFLRMVLALGIGAEANPLVAHGVEQLGLPLIVVAKVGLIVLVVAIFSILARRYQRTAALVATTAVLAGLFGAWTNVMTLV